MVDFLPNDFFFLCLIFRNTDHFKKQTNEKKPQNILCIKPLFPSSSLLRHSSLSSLGNAKLVQTAEGLALINLKPPCGLEVEKREPSKPPRFVCTGYCFGGFDIHQVF